MIDVELLEMLESTVTIAPLTARALDGKKSHGSADDYRAHISVRHDMVRNTSGEEVMAAGSADLDSAYPDITESSLLTLQDGSTPSMS
jgi:hypothetical protein